MAVMWACVSDIWVDVDAGSLEGTPFEGTPDVARKVLTHEARIMTLHDRWAPSPHPKDYDINWEHLLAVADVSPMTYADWTPHERFIKAVAGSVKIDLEGLYQVKGLAVSVEGMARTDWPFLDHHKYLMLKAAGADEEEAAEQCGHGFSGIYPCVTTGTGRVH